MQRLRMPACNCCIPWLLHSLTVAFLATLLQELCELLDIRLVEIRRRWQEGRLQAIGFRWAGCALLMTAPLCWGATLESCCTVAVPLRGPGGANTSLACCSCVYASPACSAEEVAHLVQALFEDTDLRRDFLHLLAQQQEEAGLL